MIVRNDPGNTERQICARWVLSPATLCISVDLPEPEGPMMAVKRRAANSTVTPSSARTSFSPRP
jgi:hypothetical protein